MALLKCGDKGCTPQASGIRVGDSVLLCRVASRREMLVPRAPVSLAAGRRLWWCSLVVLCTAIAWPAAAVAGDGVFGGAAQASAVLPVYTEHHARELAVPGSAPSSPARRWRPRWFPFSRSVHAGVVGEPRLRAGFRSVWQQHALPAVRWLRSKDARLALKTFAVGLLWEGPKSTYWGIVEHRWVFAGGLLLMSALSIAYPGAHGLLVAVSAAVATAQTAVLIKHKPHGTFEERALCSGEAAWAWSLVGLTAWFGAMVPQWLVGPVTGGDAPAVTVTLLHSLSKAAVP